MKQKKNGKSIKYNEHLKKWNAMNISEEDNDHVEVKTINVKWGLIIPSRLINHHCPKKNVI